MTSSVVTLPNALSATRILLMPVLIALAAQGREYLFLGILAFALLTDALDGYFARLLHQTSSLGVKLDSWGDLLTYITMVVGLWLLWPEVFVAQLWYLLLGVGFYFLPLMASLFKFGALPRFHTWAAKLAALLIAPAYFVMVIWDYGLFFRLVILFHVWVALEELLIVFILNRNQYNVPTFLHARTMAAKARRQLQLRRERRQERRQNAGRRR